MRLLIIGGDLRSRYLAALCRQRGHAVQTVGLGETMQAEAMPMDQVVFPFPVSEVDGCAPSPLTGETLPMEAVCELIATGATVYATKPGPILSEYMQKKRCTRIDFTDYEAFTVRNAVPSAEGAIHALMSCASVCLTGQSCLIVGYGRIGRALALRLIGLGACVTVAARSDAARATALSDGCRAVPMERMGDEPHRFVINTVPSPVMGEEMLMKLPDGAICIDLASPPYGIDLEAAQRLGIEAFRAPGLPGKYAPETAAEAMLCVIEECNGA